MMVMMVMHVMVTRGEKTKILAMMMTTMMMVMM